MEFCNKCENYLYYKEYIVNDIRKLFYYCKKCNYKKECENKQIILKTYKTKKKILKEDYLNYYKIQDKTLPRKLTKCKHCHKKNNNPYEVKYINNLYTMNLICVNCKKNFYKIN
jgi:DNA-directed RNA polymerase subunit M/transcription elongation factor TFIIS